MRWVDCVQRAQVLGMDGFFEVRSLGTHYVLAFIILSDWSRRSARRPHTEDRSLAPRPVGVSELQKCVVLLPVLIVAAVR